LPLIATFGRRIPRSTLKIDIFLSRLRLRQLFEPAPHDVGVVQLILGRLLRPLH
jgi:hypothetical protein